MQGCNFKYSIQHYKYASNNTSSSLPYAVKKQQSLTTLLTTLFQLIAENRDISAAKMQYEAPLRCCFMGIILKTLEWE